MSKVILHLKDAAHILDSCNLNPEAQQDLVDRFRSGAKKTRIKFVNHDTGETLGEYENKVILPGSQFNAMSVFGIKDPAVNFPNYNDEMGLDKSVSGSTERENEPIVCLFSVADSGCGATHDSIKVTSYTDRLKPGPKNASSYEDFDSDMIMPFRFVPLGDDLSSNLRKYYFGRKVYTNLEYRLPDGNTSTGNFAAYFFKKFDTDPMLHLRYADGTQIGDDVWTVSSDQETECYVEMRMRITRLDLRDYFDKILGWDKARFSAMSLNFAWYNTDEDTYNYYQEILPYSLLNFDYKELQDLTVAIDILYEIYY